VLAAPHAPPRQQTVVCDRCSVATAPVVCAHGTPGIAAYSVVPGTRAGRCRWSPAWTQTWRGTRTAVEGQREPTASGRVRGVGLLVAMLAGLLLIAGAGPAAAEPPLRVADQITDPVGALSRDTARVLQALDALRREDRTQLFVVFVASFDGLGGQEWADRSARLSQLGGRDVLLAVAVRDRAYGYSVDAGLAVTAAELEQIVAEDVEPRLAAGDWSGAAVAMADGLRTGRPAGSGGVPVGVLVGGLALLGGGLFLLARRRRRISRKAESAGPSAAPGPTDEYAGVSTEDLGYRASTMLIEVDDAVRTSEEALAAARVQFGNEAVAGFRTALDESRRQLVNAFELRQRLDDGETDDGTRRQLLGEILRLCRAADERLDAQAAEFDRLRELASKVEDVVAALQRQLKVMRSRVPDAAARHTELRERYAASALAAVADNVDQAGQRLDAAGQQLESAQADLRAGSRGRAAVTAQAVQQALDQAGTLLDAISRVAADIAAAAEQFPAAQAALAQDLAEARAMLTDGDPRRLRPTIARAEAAIESATRLARPPRPDPPEALRLLEQTEATLDEALSAARDTQARAERAALALQHAMLTARSAVAAAHDFITTRRGAIGAEARTRLAQAQQYLDSAAARSAGDPAAALQDAQHADNLAQQALHLAQTDVAGWAPPRYGDGGSAAGIDLGSLVLGGILLGGPPRGYRGGLPPGEFRGGFTPGGFGGTGARGRRGGGGRF
jgi:uncharacterized protein YukE